MIKEHDRIVLTGDLADGELRDGDVGTVVHVYPDGDTFEVEFLTLDGETVSVVSLPASQVRPIGKREVTHARSLTAA